MPIDLFGYNGVFEFDQNVVSKLLATYLYEQHLVAPGDKVSDGDFILAKAPIKDGEIHLYLELARPFLHIQTADGTNLVTLHVPFSQVGVFLLLQNGVPIRLQLPFQSGQLLAFVLFDVPIQKTDSGLSIDLSGLTGENVGIQTIWIKPGPTGVGAAMLTDSPAHVPHFLDDAEIENMLLNAVSAKVLRNQLANFLKTGVIGPTSVPISPGGTESALRSWDLLLFGNANDRDSTDQPGDAGADLLLFQDGNTGRGVRTDAGQTLPPALETPPYAWTVSLRASVLLDDIRQALDNGLYYVQGGVENTPDNPLGYLVVPATGSRGYTLPTGAGKITVAAPQNGQAQVTIAGGGLTPHSRARLRNLDRSIESGFTADGGGGATLSIRADPGERLALTIDAISLPSDSSKVISRPQITFGDGEIAASFHFYYYLKTWCDIESDVSVRLALYADRTKSWSIGVRVIDANASGPWWAYVVAWLGPGLIGQGVFPPILVGLVPTIMHALAQSFIGGNIGTLGSALTDHISAPSPENVVMVLDQVDVYPTGVQLSGRADSGEILAYDRSVAFSTQPGVVLSAPPPSPVYMSFDWKPDFGTISVTSANRCAVITDDASKAFWEKGGYDDIPTDDAFTRDPFSLKAGDTVMVWVEIDGGQAKVLFERPLLDLLPISITWIVLQQRVGRSVKLVNNLAAGLVGGEEGLALELEILRWDGTISLSTQKFFLSDDTQAVGDEQWFWDEQAVTDMGLIFPGGSITLDPAQRQLIVHLDQSGLPDQQNIPVTHWVRFHGTDVFGLTLEAKILVWTPPKMLLPRPIALNPPLGPGFIDPLGGDRPAFDRTQLVGALIDLLATRIGPIEAQSLARSVANALAMGAATLDGAGAAGVLALLGGGARFGQH